MEAHHMNPLTGQDDMLEAALAFAGTGMAGAAHGALLQAGDGGGAVRLVGQGRAQRTVPLRLRQEIQALPRRLRLRRGQGVTAAKGERQ